MNEIDKNRLVITKLIQETQKGSIIWNSYVDEEIKLIDEGEVIDKVYTTEYKNRKFRMFRYKYKEYGGGFLGPDKDYWRSDVKLEILDKFDYPEWEFPSDNSLNDLYETVRYKVANVKSLFDDILGLEIIKATYETSKKNIDITVQLRALIANNELTVIASNEIGGDPDPGTPKTLKIKYEFKGDTKEKIFNEGQVIKLP